MLSPDRSTTEIARPAAADVQRCPNFHGTFNLAVGASPSLGDVLQNMKNAVDAESYSVAAGAGSEWYQKARFAIAERNV